MQSSSRPNFLMGKSAADLFIEGSRKNSPPPELEDRRDPFFNNYSRNTRENPLKK